MVSILPDLIATLHDHPEEAGLRPFHRIDTNNKVNDIRATNETMVTIVPGLNAEVFLNRRITFFGDSTVRFPTQYLQVLLNNHCKLDVDYVYDNMTLSAANSFIRKKGKSCSPEVRFGPNGRTTPRHTYPTNTTQIHYSNACADDHMVDKDPFIDRAWRETMKMQPQVLVVNMALHWLSFMGMGKEVNETSILRWIFYEEWLQEAIDEAIDIGVEIILFKTTNLICADKWQGKLARAHKKYTSTDTLVLNQTLRECERLVKALISVTNLNVTRRYPSVTKEQVSLYCRYGTFSDKGANYLNYRLYRFIQKLPSNLSIKFGIFDDRGIESCEYTQETDGRHYRGLILARLRLLGNILSCTESWSNDQMKIYAEQSAQKILGVQAL